MRTLPRLRALIERLPISEGTMSLPFVTTLLAAWAAEALAGMAAITSALLVGLPLSCSP